MNSLNGILVLSVWLLSLKMIVRFIHVFHVLVSHSFLLSSNIPLYVHSTIYLSNSPVDGHLACSQVLAFINKTAMNIHI